jgi:hypothetical protein
MTHSPDNRDKFKQSLKELKGGDLVSVTLYELRKFRRSILLKLHLLSILCDEMKIGKCRIR